MNLSLVSQKPSAATTLGVLAALRAASGDGHYFTEITVAQPDRWQPSKEEAAILLLEDDDAPWPESRWVRQRHYVGIARFATVGSSAI